MNETVRKGGRDADPRFHVIPGTRYPSPRGWQERPVVVFDVCRGDTIVLKGRDRQRERDAFLCELERVGHGPSGVVAIQQDADIASFAWRRNVGWKSLPSLTSPSYRGGYCPRSFMDDAGLWHDVHDERTSLLSPVLSRGSRLLIVSDYAYDDRAIHKVASLAGPGIADIEMMHFNGQTLRPIAPAEIERIRWKYAAHDRFLFNYGQNMYVICGRAWVAAAREFGRTQAQVEVSVPSPIRYGSLSSRLSDPIALQMLYALHDHGPTMEASGRRLRDPHSGAIAAMETFPFFERQDGHFTFSWQGSGKYAPWRLDMGTPDDRTSRMYEWGGIIHVIKDLVAAGLVGLADGKAVITPLGGRFLDLLGRQGHDPDMPLRWRTVDGRFGAPEDIPAMDRWLNRTFRGLKRATARLPASPPTEETETKWPRVGENRVLVRGYMASLDTSKLEAPVVQALIAEFTKHESVTPLKDRRFGVVRSDVGFGQEEQVLGLWIGIPLAIQFLYVGDVFKLDYLKDWSLIDEEAMRWKETHPLFPSAHDLPETIQIGRTSQAQETFVVPPEAAVLEKDAAFSIVVKGRIFQIDEAACENAFVKRHFQRYRRGVRQLMPSDGVRITGERGGMHVLSLGLMAGRLDHGTGRLTVQTRFSPVRLDHISWLAGCMESEGEFPFDRPGLSKDSYWLISADGSFRELSEDEVAQARC
jgi:hypothetical protein